MNAISPIPMAYRSQDQSFPKGWYCVAESKDIVADTLTPVSYLDQQLVVYRTTEGKAQVADAYCPHLGAHVASSDGCITDGQIVCPFHKWRFDAATGKCVSIPYAKAIPNVGLTLYPTREIAGMVVIWYHPLGAPPDHEPFVNAAFHDGKWIEYGVKEWVTSCPFRDILENLFDTAHIVYLHNSYGMPEMGKLERMPHGLSIDYEMDPDNNEFPVTGMHVDFTGVTLSNQLTEGRGFATLYVSSFTPLDRERFLLKTRIYIRDMGSPEMLEAIGRPFLERFVYEVGQDLKVLDYKKHLDSPKLCSGDGPIMKFREYAEQFWI